MNRPLYRYNIVLLGIGHTNAHIVKKWRMKPIEGANLICVSDFPRVTYSGMLPGVLSGQYEQEEMEIDLVRLCSVSGARLIVDPVLQVDVAGRCLRFENRPPVPYDWLSIGVGSRPTTKGVEISNDARLVRIKPMQTFLNRLRSAMIEAQTANTNGRLAVNVVGGGVGGIEIALCLNQRLKSEISNRFHIRIVAGSEIGNGLLPSTQSLVKAQLVDQGIETIENQQVDGVSGSEISLANGSKLPSDLIFWATGAEANEFLRQVDLPQDERGFLLTRDTLQSTADERVFAVGDSGTNLEDPTPKAGVYAVRQGPVLWNNFKRAVNRRPLKPYRPQRGFLKLLNLGDGRAIAEYMGRSAVGRWCWRLKDYIDRKFMRMYQDYRPRRMKPEPAKLPDEMRCLGCGGKLGGASLRAALDRLGIEPSDKIILGLDNSDDAAIIRTAGNSTTVTTDFFAAPFDDPYLIGRIAALNSASDCFVMNAQPTAALAIAQVPVGHPRAQSDVLYELLAGAQQEFSKMGATIAGGHSIEGPRLTVGFTVLADQRGEATTKGRLNIGDQLILSKPIGTGVLLAAHMRGLCRAEWFSGLVETMLGSNQIALDIADQFQVAAMTDVTGFGLAGHLCEMLGASGVVADLELERVPLIDGSLTLSEQGVRSSLTPDNQQSIGDIENSYTGEHSVALSRLMFDPQTAGGLLFGVKPEDVQRALQALGQTGFERAAVIGTVTGKSTNGQHLLTIR